MPRTVPASIQYMLETGQSTLAWVISVFRKDGAEYHMTSHDRDLSVVEPKNGTTVTAKSALFSASAVAGHSDMSVTTLNLSGLLGVDTVLEYQVIYGVWDEAQVYFYLVNWNATAPIGSTQHVKIQHGTVGAIRLNDSGSWEAEVRGLTQVLQQRMLEVTSPQCRADFCDARCGLSASDYQVTGTCSGAETQDLLNITVGSNFINGMLTLTSGANAGLSMEIMDVGASQVRVFHPFPFPVESGTTYTALPGCDKQFSTCRHTYNNKLNFRGEPRLPGMDKALEYPNYWGVGG